MKGNLHALHIATMAQAAGYDTAYGRRELAAELPSRIPLLVPGRLTDAGAELFRPFAIHPIIPKALDSNSQGKN